MVGEDYDFYRGETVYDTTYYIGDDLSRGRVEICKGGGYHTICLDLWDERDASVVCQELGFSPNGKECDITTNVQFTMTRLFVGTPPFLHRCHYYWWWFL